MVHTYHENLTLCFSTIGLFMHQRVYTRHGWHRAPGTPRRRAAGLPRAKPTRVSQHDQPSLSARPPPRMPASKKSTGTKITGRNAASGTLENGHDSRCAGPREGRI